VELEGLQSILFNVHASLLAGQSHCTAYSQPASDAPTHSSSSRSSGLCPLVSLPLRSRLPLSALSTLPMQWIHTERDASGNMVASTSRTNPQHGVASSPSESAKMVFASSRCLSLLLCAIVERIETPFAAARLS